MPPALFAAASRRLGVASHRAREQRCARPKLRLYARPPIGGETSELIFERRAWVMRPFHSAWRRRADLFKGKNSAAARRGNRRCRFRWSNFAGFQRRCVCLGIHTAPTTAEMRGFGYRVPDESLSPPGIT